MVRVGRNETALPLVEPETARCLPEGDKPAVALKRSCFLRDDLQGKLSCIDRILDRLRVEVQIAVAEGKGPLPGGHRADQFGLDAGNQLDGLGGRGVVHTPAGVLNAVPLRDQAILHVAPRRHLGAYATRHAHHGKHDQKRAYARMTCSPFEHCPKLLLV